MEWLSSTADMIGILGAVFALFAWWQARQLRATLAHEQQRQRKKVTLVLAHGAELYELPIELQRAEITRAEVMGVLGMLPMKVPRTRFSIGYVSTKDFLDDINDIVTSEGDRRLRIPCQKEEFEQFDLVAFQRKTS